MSEIILEQRDPAPKARGRRVNLDAVLKQVLSANTRQWYCIAKFEHKSSAQTYRALLNKGKIQVPGGKWSFEARPAGEGSELFARCIVP